MGKPEKSGHHRRHPEKHEGLRSGDAWLQIPQHLYRFGDDRQFLPQTDRCQAVLLSGEGRYDSPQTARCTARREAVATPVQHRTFFAFTPIFFEPSPFTGYFLRVLFTFHESYLCSMYIWSDVFFLQGMIALLFGCNKPLLHTKLVIKYMLKPVLFFVFRMFFQFSKSSGIFPYGNSVRCRCKLKYKKICTLVCG